MNTYIAELREIDPPMITRRLRFIPYIDHPKTICMRVEVYGCDWKGITSLMLINAAFFWQHSFWKNVFVFQSSQFMLKEHVRHTLEHFLQGRKLLRTFIEWVIINRKSVLYATLQ